MLKTCDIYLSPLQVNDSERLHKWISDRNLVISNAPYVPVSDLEHRQWFESIVKNKSVHIFAIRKAEDNQLIGCTQLHSINHVHRHAEFQIRIGEVAEQGKGYGKQATFLMLYHAFHDLNLERVFLHVFRSNKPALSIYRKIGFKEEGILRRHIFIDDQYIDLVLMGIFKNEINSALYEEYLNR